MNKSINDLYRSNLYIIKNPSLHKEDSPWKVSKIIPLIDRFINRASKDEINLLDVGGGAGVILNIIASYIEKKHNIKVNKYALDVSPGMLEVQKKVNPKLKKILNEDIRKTSLNNKEIDLTMMIDILEHVPNPTKALEEIKRISKFAILKVPLEDNLSFKTIDFLRKGKVRQKLVESIGHINTYNLDSLTYQVQKHTGKILYLSLTNMHEYFLSTKHHRKKTKLRGKLAHLIAMYLFKLSPKLCTLIFTDFAVILVKCA